MKNILILLVVTLSLSACASAPDFRPAFYNQLRYLIGHEKNELFENMGYPDNYFKLDDKTIYLWQNNGAAITSYHSFSYATSSQTTFNNCNIKIIVGEDNNIIDFESNFNSSCQLYHDRLKRYMDKKYPKPPKAPKTKACRVACKNKANINYSKCNCEQ